MSPQRLPRPAARATVDGVRLPSRAPRSGTRSPRARGTAVAGGLLAFLVLAACSKPTPGVTLQSGTRSVRAEATLYIRDGKQVHSSAEVTVLRTHPGQTVGIDVDRDLAAKGWQVHITTGTSGSSVFNSGVLKSHHYSFEVGAQATDVVVSEIGSTGTPTGLWAFSVQPTLQ